MRGSVLIITIHILMIMSLLLLTAFSIAQSHFLISGYEDLHQEAYYLTESGMRFAMEELRDITRQAFEECTSEFKWDPLKYPLHSKQEAAQIYINDKLSSKIKKLMTDKGCYFKFPSPELAGVPENSKLDIKVKFTDFYNNPSRFRISSRGEIGKIRRRIDSEIFINKISGYYNSPLFDWIILSGGEVSIKNGGKLQTEGQMFLKEKLKINNNADLVSSACVTAKGEINLQNNSTAFFSGDVFCRSLAVDGGCNSQVSFLSDLYTYGEIVTVGEANEIELYGSLYACPEDTSDSVGLIAGDGGSIVLGNHVYINGTLNYPASQPFLFGLENVSVGSEVFKSPESIGGWNSNFYFPDFTPNYAACYFDEIYANLHTREQAALVYEYLSSPPPLEENWETYVQHLSNIDKNSINTAQTEGGTVLLGHSSGLLFINNQILKPLNSIPSSNFYKDLLVTMKMQTDWDYRSQLNFAIEVLNKNLILNRNSFAVLQDDLPFIYICPEEKDIILPQGSYEGILVTNGSILVEPGTQVEHKGLLIAGKDIIVDGYLKVKQDKNMLLNLLSWEDESFRSFFKVESEKDLFEVRFSKEVLYNMQW
ncbi:MAG: hypothetical protein PHG58_01310 [Clostridia bacterium]|nr:hypothetical protein [Clostridia bacterium]